MHVVKAIPFHRNAKRGLNAVRYISHREERTAGGETRDLYGLGARYKAISTAHTDRAERERALTKALESDAAKVLATTKKPPPWHHHVFSVDDRAAHLLAAMPKADAERTMRDTLQKTFRASAEGRKLEGVYAIHWHSKARHDHPHIHVLYSPRRCEGNVNTYISTKTLAALKQGWNREINKTLRLEPEPNRGPRRRPRAAPRPRPMSAHAIGRVAGAIRNPARAAAGLVVKATARQIPGGGAALTIVRTAAAFARNPVQAAVRMAATRALAAVVPVPPAVVRGTMNIVVGRDR